MSLCRTCLSENDLKPIFSDKSIVSARSEQLYLVTGVKIEVNDGLPQLICVSCTDLIKSASKLREQSSKSQETLKNTFINNIKKETIEDYLKNEDNTEYYIVDFNEQNTGQLNDELNTNVEHEEKNYMFIQIQNHPECSATNISNTEHEKKKVKENENLNSEHGRKYKKILTRNGDDNKLRRGKYWLNKYGERNADYKFSVSIEDFESSNDEDFMDDTCVEPGSGTNKRPNKVRIEDFESSDSLDLDDDKSDSSEFEDLYVGSTDVVGNESTGVTNHQMTEAELLQREQKKLTSKEQETKLMSLAVTPYNRNGPVKCRICDRVVRNMQNFKSHAKTHFELENTCEECGKKFVNRSHMRYHQQRVHGRTKRLACTQCPYRAVDLQTLQNHERAEHTGERPYICNECGVSFRMRANIMQHMRKHFGVRNLQCDRCPAMFRSRSELWGHQNKVHLMIYTYLCYLCPETYKRPLSVRKHLANVHGVPTDQQLRIKCIKTNRRSCDKSD